MKKLINDPLAVVREMLEGVVALAPGLALLADETVVVRAGLPVPAERGVALLSGGGSGHEPAHAGFVGAGMLSAAVAGDVFTSPSSDAVLAGLRAVGGPAGVLLLVKNYTGDRLNFGLAAEMASAEGIPTEVVVIADDVALRHLVEDGRRRGIAGTVLVHKIAGAAAARGLPLAEVARLARDAARDIGTMGVALGACTLPAAGRPGFELGPDEIELGLGIHGEKGVERTSLQPVDALVERMVATIVEDRAIAAGERVALLVNGLGATPPMELAIATRAALASLRARGIVVARAWCGTLLSALDMPGCSVSVMRVDDARLSLLDAPTTAPAWPGPGLLNEAPVTARRVSHGVPAGDGEPTQGLTPLDERANRTKQALRAIAQVLIAEEATLTDLDAKAGDGDLGASLARGAAAVLDLPDSAWRSPSDALSGVGHALRRAIGGSSGPFYATALLRAARHLSETPDPSGRDWAEAFRLAVARIADLGGARPGDRTMLDALHPAAEAFADALDGGRTLEAAWADCVAAARTGAAATAAMLPRVGRASYLGDRALGAPDGGAVAVSIWLATLTPFVR